MTESTSQTDPGATESTDTDQPVIQRPIVQEEDDTAEQLPSGGDIAEEEEAPTQLAAAKKTVVVHTAVAQAAASSGGGYPKQTWVLHDGVVWASLKDNNNYHPGGLYWDLAY